MQSANTPEALLPRCDSLNAATTCKGLTSSGRPCRRSMSTSLKRASRFIALEGDDGALDAAAFFCWQHKGQAPTGIEEVRQQLEPIGEGRASLDSLADRLGVMSVVSEKRDKRGQGKSERQKQRLEPQRRVFEKKRSKPGFWQSFSCFAVPEQDLDYRIEIVRHRNRRPKPENKQHHPVAPLPPLATSMSSTSNHAYSKAQSQNSANSSKKSKGTTAELIPKSLPPDTAAALHAQLEEPISQHDEDGYIYMFWLTDEKDDTPSEADTATILGSSQTVRPDPSRHPSELLQRYGTVRSSASMQLHRQSHEPAQQKSIVLKIGRTSNVHRRMNQWSRQCGYNLSLLRFYPYTPLRSPTTSPQAGHRPKAGQQTSSFEPQVRKVPFSHRVERLIHIELQAQRVAQDACQNCGSKHREWFQVHATKRDVKAIDAVVRKWVAWAEDAARIRS